MIFNVKKLNKIEKGICFKTISPRAIFAIVSDAIKSKKSISIVRMGDGEYEILNADKSKPFTVLDSKHKDWNKGMGIEGAHTAVIQKRIIESGNSCTYFAPSVSGVSIPKYFIYNFFKSRPFYFDNFFVNDWNKSMIGILLKESNGVFILHKDYKEIIKNFKKNYGKEIVFGGFPKKNMKDNKQAVRAAIKSGMQLFLFSAGPGGKIIGPQIANGKGRVAIDVGNTLIHWSKAEGSGAWLF